MNALTDEVEDLRELVDGQEPWSHRKRLHLLEDDKRAAELVTEAIDRLKAVEVRERRSKWTAVREWASFVAAVAAIAATVILTLYVKSHHGG